MRTVITFSGRGGFLVKKVLCQMLKNYHSGKRVNGFDL